MIRRLSFLIVLLLTPIAVLLAPRAALAAPEAHILRIDPRAGVKNGKPTLTTVVEVVQFKRLSDVLQPCAGRCAGCAPRARPAPDEAPGGRRWE